MVHNPVHFKHNGGRCQSQDALFLKQDIFMWPTSACPVRRFWKFWWNIANCVTTKMWIFLIFFPFVHFYFKEVGQDVAVVQVPYITEKRANTLHIFSPGFPDRIPPGQFSFTCHIKPARYECFFWTVHLHPLVRTKQHFVSLIAEILKKQLVRHYLVRHLINFIPDTLGFCGEELMLQSEDLWKDPHCPEDKEVLVLNDPVSITLDPDEYIVVTYEKRHHLLGGRFWIQVTGTHFFVKSFEHFVFLDSVTVRNAGIWKQL